MSKPRSPRSPGHRTTSWEGRLRDMVLAGGALAVAGCAGTVADDVEFSASDDAGNGLDASRAHDAGSDAVGTSSGFCCNANPDPCCEVDYCDASMNPACACQLDGGTPVEVGGPTPTLVCAFGDGAVSDDDAGADADVGD